jgi:hypothetical protein
MENQILEKEFRNRRRGSLLTLAANLALSPREEGGEVTSGFVGTSSLQRPSITAGWEDAIERPQDVPKYRTNMDEDVSEDPLTTGTTLADKLEAADAAINRHAHVPFAVSRVEDVEALASGASQFRRQPSGDLMTSNTGVQEQLAKD